MGFRTSTHLNRSRYNRINVKRFHYILIVCLLCLSRGATHSHAVLMKLNGKIIGRAKGPGTNHHLIGMEECKRRIADLINAAKDEAGMNRDSPLLALGLGLSGCGSKESDRRLEIGLLKEYPCLSENYVIREDTVGSIAATSNKGGIVCIAGTGSNTLLINPDGTKAQCGGWGNLLGDEGSAWKISHRAVKYCFDDIDEFEKSPYPIYKVWELVKKHFVIESQADILDSFYKNFDKAHIASLCKKLADLARDEDDELSKSIFEEAGIDLAKSIRAVVTKAAPELHNKSGGIHILCVGSVWLSWDLLQAAFVKWIQDHTDIEALSLVRLKTESGYGAALMASDLLDLNMYRDYATNYTVFYRFNKNNTCMANNHNHVMP